MVKKSLALSKVYRVLEPGPVVMVTTARKGQFNIMTMSWHTMMEFEPPVIGCVISNRNYSFNVLKSTKQCVINVPTVDLAAKVVKCGNLSGSKVDKFKALQLTPMKATAVQAPLIDECYINLECKVIDMRMVTQYNFFILEVVKAWIDPKKKHLKTLHHLGKGIFVVDGRIIRLPSKMK